MALTQVSRGLLSTSIVDNGNATAITIDSSENVTFSGTATMDGLTVDSTTGFSWLPVSTAGAKVGTIGTGTGLIINTPSVNASFGSGLAIDGSYSSDVSTINLKAFGPKFSSYSSQLAFHTSSGTSLTERMRIDSSGRVGIGTSSLSSFYSGANQLVVGSGSGEQGITLHAGATSTSYLLFADGTSGTSLFAGQVNYHHNTNSLNFCTNGVTTPRATIDASGNLLVGTTTTNIATEGTVIYGSGNEGVMQLSSTSMPTLYVNRSDTGQIVQFRQGGSSIVGTISTNANSLPSDRNFKTNINDLALGLDFVASLKPVTYNYKIDEAGAPVMSGLIAQDVEESLDAAGVAKNSMTILQHKPLDDEKQSDYEMDYLKLVPVLINAIKEQQTTITDLTTRLTALENN